MSDAQNPVEEVPAAVPATEAPATETPAVEAPQETPAVTEETAAPAAEETTDAPAEQEEAKEVTPASEGVLGHKAPGLVKGLRFTKRFLYFSDDAVEAKNLSAFKQNEKPAVANPTVAWASQTGKGLLFLAKRAEDKATPAGIFNLSDVSDITKDGSNEFHFKVNGQKHTFQAADATERDSWVVALETKATDAKAEKETITASEGYKAELEKLTKPVVAEPAKKADAEEATPAEESNAKSRSQSRKRISIFGSLRTPKKEEAEEKAEELKPAEATVTTEVVAEAPTEVAEVAAPAETAEKKEEEKKAEIKSKRASIFGNFFQKVTSPSTEKSEKEATAPAETAVASTAPQLENPVEEVEVPAVEPETVTAPAEEAVTAAVEAPAAEVSPVAKDKRRTSFFGNFGKKKGDSDNEGTDAESKPKGNKLGGLFRKPSKVVKSETKETEAQAEPVAQEAPIEESPEETAAAPAEAPATEESKPVDVTSTSTPVQATA